MNRHTRFFATLAPVTVAAFLLSGCGQQPAQKSDAAGGAGAPKTPTTRMVFSAGGPVTMKLAPGKSYDWTLRIEDAQTSKAVAEFDTVHEKPMHLIVVSKDLTYFRHLHPENMSNGVFAVKASLPDAGTYKLFADYKPRGGQPDVAEHELEVKPAASKKTRGAAARLMAEPLKAGWITRNVDSYPEETPHREGGKAYQVALMPMPAKPIAGQESILHFQVRDPKGKPYSDLQPYLGGFGHCVVISSDTKTYLHTHPGEDEQSKGETATKGGPDVMFYTTFPKAGLYKVWGQFKHRGKIVTASFVVEAVERSGNTGPADEHAGHAH